MLQKNFLMIVSCLCILNAKAQYTPPAKPAAITQPAFDYKKINPNLSYAFIVNKPTPKHPQEGDQVSLVMQSVCNNRQMYSTYIAFKGKPGVYGVTKPAYKGDIIEAILLMTAGDSIVCLTDADALFKNSKTKLPDFIKAGDKDYIEIKENFNGTMSMPLMGTDRSLLFKSLGMPVKKDIRWESYQMRYGSLILFFDGTGKVNSIIITSKNAETLNLCE